MTGARGRWAAAARAAQLVLILVAFCLDFAHGISLGQDRTGFHPIYRVRQSMAVAISRLREPPLHGYLAYQSVLDALNRNGFAINANDVGPRPDAAGWTAFLSDPDAVEHALTEAKTTPIDTSRPPQLIIINELAYADFIYAGFRLFGVHMSSLYYLYFVLLGISCLLFIVAFRASPALMFLLLSYLAGLFFLQNYLNSYGIQSATLTNSRVFEALSLLPTIHVFMTIWRRMPFSWTVFAIVSAQSALLVFLVDCRTTALWQIMLIGCVGIGVAVAALVRRPVSGHSHRWTAAWPAVIAPILLVAHMAAIQKSADPRYATETKTHVIWHEVLSGILGASPELQRAYTGTEHGIDFLDSDPYAAVVRDINARNDRSSKIAIVHDGRIDLDASVDQNEYERLKRAMAFKIIRERPGAVGVGIYNKFVEQAESFARKDAMSPGNLAGAALLTALGTLVWLIAQGYPPPADQVRGGAAAGGIILLFSTAPVVIEPSSLSVGTLLSFLVALALGISTTIVLAVHRLREHATRLMWNSGHADG